MNRLLIAGAAVAALCTAMPASAAVIVVPPAPGNAQGPAPLRYYGTGGSRVQQIYASSYFTGPQTITALSFRAYPGAAPSGFFSNSVSVSNISVTAGLTGASGNDSSGLPSTTFANNITGGQTVFSGPLTLTTAATGTGSQPFDYTISFSSPFLYDPAAGNLIFDFLVPTNATVTGGGFGFLTFDTVNSLNDGIYSVLDITNGGATTGTLSTAGAITQFTTAQVAGAVPEPATWAMMLVGFGGIGMAMRRSRRAKGPLSQIA